MSHEPQHKDPRRTIFPSTRKPCHTLMWWSLTEQREDEIRRAM